MNVLIVDDLFYIREEIREILEKNGYNVVDEAESGLEAIEAYRRLKPDIISMDVNMPEMDGLEAIKRIRAEDKEVKILLCSTMVDFGFIKDEADDLGVKGFVKKPFSESEYMKEIEKLK